MGLIKKEIKVLYHDTEMSDLLKLGRGDWIDLRCHSVAEVKMDDRLEISPDSPLVMASRNNQSFDIEPLRGIYEDRLVDIFKYKKGDYLLINLGVSIELPKGYEAMVAPRSSTFKNYGIIQTNSPSTIDNPYKGHDDIWFMPVYALRDGFMIKDERICQFRIQKNMPRVNLKSVTNLLNNSNRGGHGVSGTK